MGFLVVLFVFIIIIIVVIKNNDNKLKSPSLTTGVNSRYDEHKKACYILFLLC